MPAVGGCRCCGSSELAIETRRQRVLLRVAFVLVAFKVSMDCFAFSYSSVFSGEGVSVEMIFRPRIRGADEGLLRYLRLGLRGGFGALDLPGLAVELSEQVLCAHVVVVILRLDKLRSGLDEVLGNGGILRC